MQNQRLAEIIRFLFVGGGCFLLDYGLLYYLTESVGIPYLFSSAISFTVSLVVNYLLCVTVVFRAKNQSREKTFWFIVTSLAGLGVNQICMWFFAEICGLWYMIAKIGAAAVVTIWNYVTKRMILTR